MAESICTDEPSNPRTPMAGKSKAAETSALAAAPAAASRSREAGTAEQRPSSLQWPLAWFNEATSEAWRVWSRFPQLELTESVGRGAEPTTVKRPRPPDARQRADSPTSLDRLLHASTGRFTMGLSPAALWLAYADWAIHLWASPGRCQQLVEKSVRKGIRFLTYLSQAASDPASPPCIEPLPQDHRFRSEAWQRPPFNLIYQAFLLNQQWWHSAMTGIGGVSPHHEQVIAFVTRQLLDTVSPVNFIATNPEVLAATLHEGGQNLIRGAGNFWADWERAIGGKPPIGAEEFQPGERVAVTKGKVIYRNRLIELIATVCCVADRPCRRPSW
jgi:polyhydroxyalkanoate synthase subunit PhaC